MQYLRLADAQARLQSCIIQYKGEPVFIDSIQEPAPMVLVASGTNLVTKRSVSITLNENWLSPPKFRLGYTNVFHNKTLQVIMMQRVPARRSYLGLCSNNSSARNIFSNLELDSIRLSWTNVFLGTGFLNAQNNEFFNLKQVVEYGKGAVSSEFAMYRMGLKIFHIYWEDNIIGEFSTKDNTIELYPPYAWCVETLQNLFSSKGEAVRVSVSV